MPIKTETETPRHTMPETWLMLNQWTFLVKLMNEWAVDPSPLRCGPAVSLKSGNIEICEFRVNAYEEELEDVLGTDLFL